MSKGVAEQAADSLENWIVFFQLLDSEKSPESLANSWSGMKEEVRALDNEAAALTPKGVWKTPRGSSSLALQYPGDQRHCRLDHVS